MIKHNKTSIISFIITIIVTIVLGILLINQKQQEKEYVIDYPIAKNESYEMTVEEEKALTTYDDSEIVNHVHISNLKALAVYDPPINLVGNLSNSLWLWLKYCTDDSERCWKVTINGTSYEETEDTIIFSAWTDEFPEEEIECIYNKNRAFFDFKSEVYQ